MRKKLTVMFLALLLSFSFAGISGMQPARVSAATTKQMHCSKCKKNTKHKLIKDVWVHDTKQFDSDGHLHKKTWECQKCKKSQIKQIVGKEEHKRVGTSGWRRISTNKKKGTSTFKCKKCGHKETVIY